MYSSTATVSATQPEVETADPLSAMTSASPIPTQAAAEAVFPPPSLASHRFSAEAEPFLPSYMSTVANASVTPAVSAPLDAITVSDEGDGDADVNNEDGVRQRFSKDWMYCLRQMQGNEVGMLMDMMPPDIQDLYSDKLSDEYLHEQEHADNGERAMRAALKMAQELTPQQLAHIEEFLVETDALHLDVRRNRSDGDNNDESGADDGDGDLFMNHDEDMNSDEEEWLLEQMIGTGHQADTDAK